MRWLPIVVAVVGVQTLGVVSVVTEPPPSTTTSVSVLTGSDLPADTVAPRGARVPPSAPSSMGMPGIHAQVVRLSLTGSALVPPSDPRVVGWWGRRAGARQGTTLLVGHTVHDGGGALDDLEDVPLGTTIKVGRHRYTVTSNKVISKATLAAQAERLFNQQGPHRLVIVTCEGYDPVTGHYDSNVVLVAR